MIEVVGRMMLALGVVLGVMWLLAKWARKPLAGKSGQVLGVLARQQLSRGASVAVIKVADRALVLGVTEQSVQLLTEADLAAVELSLAATDAAPSRRTLVAVPTAQDEWDDWGAEIVEPADELPAALIAAVGMQRASERASHRATNRNLRDRTTRDRTSRDRTSRDRTSRDRTLLDRKSRTLLDRKSRAAKAGPLDGSILSSKVWAQLMQGARDLTVRR